MPIPENTIKITGLNTGTVKGGSLLATSEPDSSTPPVYSSSKVSAADVADFVANDKNYAELTETTDKTLVGAINEIAQGGGGGGSSTLAGLTDVDLTSPTDGQALIYDGNTSKWVNGTGGGGNADFVELTQAQYDALEQAGQLQEDVMYFITDGNSPVSTDLIDDTTTASDKVWSSQKVDSELSALGATIPAINDSSTASTVVWSGSKINSELDGKQDGLVGGTLSNVDLNNYKTASSYWVSQTSVSNKPTTNFGYLEVIQVSTTTCLQRFTCYGNDTLISRGDTYIRFFTNNQWYSWQKVASSRPEPVKATRTGLNQAAGTSYFTFTGVPTKTGYTRMVTCANPSESGLYYLRTVESGDDLRIYMNNATSGSITYDLTIMVEYVPT